MRKNWIARYSAFWGLIIISLWMSIAFFFLPATWGEGADHQLHLQLLQGQAEDSRIHPYFMPLFNWLAQQYSGLPLLAIVLYTLQALMSWVLMSWMLYMSASRLRLLLFFSIFPMLMLLPWQAPSLYATGFYLAAGSILLWSHSIRIKSTWASWGFWLLLLLFGSIALGLYPIACWPALCFLPIGIQTWWIARKRSLRHSLQLSLLLLSALWMLWSHAAMLNPQNNIPEPTEKILAGMQDYQWENYRWNEATAQLYQEQLGWRAADYYLIQEGYRADEALLAPEAMQLLEEELGDGTHFSREGLRRKLNRFALEHLRYAGGWILLALVLLLVTISNFKVLGGLAWGLLFSTVLWMSYLLYLILIWEAPLALFGIGIAFLGLAWALLGGYKGWLSRGNKWTIFSFIALLATGYFIWQYPHLKQRQEQADLYLRWSYELPKSAHFLILDEADFCWGKSVWDCPQGDYKFFWLKTWKALPPEELKSALYASHPHYYFKHQDQKWDSYYQAYLLEHYRLGIQTQPKTLDSTTLFQLYEIQLDSNFQQLNAQKK